MHGDYEIKLRLMAKNRDDCYYAVMVRFMVDNQIPLKDIVKRGIKDISDELGVDLDIALDGLLQGKNGKSKATAESWENFHKNNFFAKKKVETKAKSKVTTKTEPDKKMTSDSLKSKTNTDSFKSIKTKGSLPGALPLPE